MDTKAQTRRPFFYALDTRSKTAWPCRFASCWEHLQGMFACGLMAGEIRANGIGRCKDAKDFAKRVNASGYRSP